MIKILFVCHGNICRSPMAEFVMKDLVQKAGLENQFYIKSAATSTEEIGNPVHSGTVHKLAQYGLSCKGKTAMQMKASDYNEYDYLIGMDVRNIANMKRIASGDPEEKIALLLDFTYEKKEYKTDIADPWYTGNFDETWNDVLAGCKGFLEYLLQNR